MVAVVSLEEPLWGCQLQSGTWGWGCALHRAHGLGNRWEPRHQTSPVLPGTAAAAQLQLWTQASLHSRKPRKPPIPTGLEVPAPVPWPLRALSAHSDFGAKLWPSPGAVATWPGVCTQGSADMPAPCYLTHLWTLVTGEYGREALGWC